MTREADFVAYGSDGRALIVETKVRAGGGNGAGWSVSVRENLIADGVIPADAWFLLATPQVLFLWEPGVLTDDVATWEMDATPVFAPYLARAGIETGSRLDGQAFEMVVAFWLRDLRDDQRPENAGPLLDKLRERLHAGIVVRGKTAA